MEAAPTSKSGSADVLSALGVNVLVTPQCTERCLAEIGICLCLLLFTTVQLLVSPASGVNLASIPP